MNKTGARYGGFLLSIMPYRKLGRFLSISHFRPPFYYTFSSSFFFFIISGGRAWRMEEKFFLFFSLLFLLLCFFCCPFIFLQSLKKNKTT